MKKKIVTAVSLLLAVSLLTSCTTFNNFKNAFFKTERQETVAKERTVKIGVFEPLSGENKTQGNLELMGIQLANEMYPEVIGKKVELLIADNQSDIYVAETAIQELVAQKPQVVLGSYGEMLTLIAGKAVKAADIPAIAITSTNPLITVNNKYYFCATYAEAKQGDALAEFAYTDQKKQKVATVKVSGDDTATANIKRFSNKAKTLSGKNEIVVGNYQIDPAVKDYTEYLTGIRESGAEAVFLDVSTTVATEFLKQAANAEMTDILFLGPKTWKDEKFLKAIDKIGSLDIAYAADFSVKSAKSASEMSKEFLKAYKQKYGEDAEPAQETAIAFDSYLMALKAIEDAYGTMAVTDLETLIAQAPTEAEKRVIEEEWKKTMETGIPTGKAIRDAIKAIQGFEGASGVISYGGTNEATKTIEVVYHAKGVMKDSYTTA